MNRTELEATIAELESRLTKARRRVGVLEARLARHTLYGIGVKKEIQKELDGVLDQEIQLRIDLGVERAHLREAIRQEEATE